MFSPILALAIASGNASAAKVFVRADQDPLAGHDAHAHTLAVAAVPSESATSKCTSADGKTSYRLTRTASVNAIHGSSGSLSLDLPVALEANGPSFEAGEHFDAELVGTCTVGSGLRSVTWRVYSVDEVVPDQSAEIWIDRRVVDEIGLSVGDRFAQSEQARSSAHAAQWKACGVKVVRETSGTVQDRRLGEFFSIALPGGLDAAPGTVWEIAADASDGARECKVGGVTYVRVEVNGR